MPTTSTHSSPTPRDQQPSSIAEALSAPFDAREIKFKPKTIKSNRALAMAYIDARLTRGQTVMINGVRMLIAQSGQIVNTYKLYTYVHKSTPHSEVSTTTTSTPGTALKRRSRNVSPNQRR
jgi:hypothetical protein